MKQRSQKPALHHASCELPIPPSWERADAGARRHRHRAPSVHTSPTALARRERSTAARGFIKRVDVGGWGLPAPPPHESRRVASCHSRGTDEPNFDFDPLLCAWGVRNSPAPGASSALCSLTRAPALAPFFAAGLLLHRRFNPGARSFLPRCASARDGYVFL